MQRALSFGVAQMASISPRIPHLISRIHPMILPLFLTLKHFQLPTMPYISTLFLLLLVLPLSIAKSTLIPACLVSITHLAVQARGNTKTDILHGTLSREPRARYLYRSLACNTLHLHQQCVSLFTRVDRQQRSRQQLEYAVCTEA